MHGIGRLLEWWDEIQLLDSRTISRLPNRSGVLLLRPMIFNQAIDIHVMLMIVSNPLPLSSYLWLHMPSRSLFQNAPVAECIPLLLAAVAGCSRDRAAVETCCMMVLVTVNLYGGCCPRVDVSAIRLWSMRFCTCSA